MKFTYRSGQRPLDGYTIKRGVGMGGFGEVYFAVSDAGKEVALKLLHRHPDAELRGIAHCLNLKHPNLIHLFDLKSDDRGDRWVVMEYVFGESLAQWINRYPTGLPTDLVKEWFGSLCRGVSYLHDQGIVHRDLKPANVFIENGHLKVGDYGLSRRVSVSQGGDMTQGVGTPNYMAPEIKNGNYTQSIDVYALGVILFEMLTGHPPFDGQTPAEVMMKHLTDKPDLDRAPNEFRAVLEKALDKNPATRFSSAKELAKAVEVVGSGEAYQAYEVVGLPQPVGMSADTPTIPAVPPGPPPRPATIPVPSRYAPGPIPQVARPRLTELAGSFAFAPLIAALCTAPWVFFTSNESWSLLGRVFLISTALTWGVLLVGRPLANPKHTWSRRFHMLLVGLGVGFFAFWLDGWAVPKGGTANDSTKDLVIANYARLSPETFGIAMKYLFFFGLTTAAVRWWAMTDSRRKERFRLWPVVATGIWASVLTFLWPWGDAPAALAFAPLVIAAVCVQVTSPWNPPVASYASRPVARPVGRKGGRYAAVAIAGLALLATVGCGTKEHPRPPKPQNESTRAGREAIAQAVAVPAPAPVSVPEAPTAPQPPSPPKMIPGQPAITINVGSSKREVRASQKPPAPALISERVTTEIPYPTEAEADTRALEDAQKLIAKKLSELDPPVDYLPPLAVVKNEYVKKDSRLVRLPNDTEKAVLDQAGYGKDRRYVEYTVEVTAEQVRELRTRNRVVDGLRGLGVIAAISLAGFLFLRLDEWSKGYLTSWLALGAAALAGGVIAAIAVV
ncbi:MAG: serine/threonine-protein kinase [Gemmataceae bacterium]